jgi:hypothetical protein
MFPVRAYSQRHQYDALLERLLLSEVTRWTRPMALERVEKQDPAFHP